MVMVAVGIRISPAHVSMAVCFFRSEEKALFDGVFIAKDDDVTRFVDYIHSTVRHVSNYTTFTCGLHVIKRT